MDFGEAIASQYRAALEMLEQAIIACPEALWHRQDDPNPFWQVAYHALFFTHLYAQGSQQTFRPWLGHREEYRFEHSTPAAPAEPATKAVVLEYLAFCRQQVAVHVPAIALDAPSGFAWLPFTRFELHLYSIRHLQQHVGELMERLGALAGELAWISSAPAGRAPQPPGA